MISLRNSQTQNLGSCKVMLDIYGGVRRVQLKNVFGTTASPMLYMVPQAMGKGTSVRYPNSLYATTTIQWVSTELDGAGKPTSKRIPVE